ncbi:MAG: FIST signal transduction protein [Bacteroidota bacterium]
MGIYSNSIQHLAKNLNKLNNDSSVHSVLIMIADKTQIKKSDINPLLKQFIKPIIGGVFPELIVDGKRMEEGILLLPLPFSFKSLLIDCSRQKDNYLEYLDEHFAGNTGKHLFVFTDVLANQKTEIIENLYNYFGLTVTYLGGGAGSLSFQPTDCIINNQGIHQNACVIALTDHPVSLDAAHGWLPISEPLKVTDAWDNLVKSINWEPAFDIYKQIVEKHSGKILQENNFFDLAKSYPLGLIKLDDELIIRDPIKTEEKKMQIVDRINQGEYIYIMHGNLDSLLKAAKKAKEGAIRNRKDFKNIFMIDCISRVLFMTDDFQKEIDIVKHMDIPVNGALTIGEIANNGSSFLEIYNKTLAIATW